MSDVNLTIVDRDENQHNIIAPTDMAMNLMEVIQSYNIVPEGTIGICGGMAMCASCQCYIENEIILPEMNEEEEAMLSEALNVKSNSRLSCQIKITKDIEGLKCKIAKEE
jgi:2Fe-2S ferredoxin